MASVRKRWSLRSDGEVIAKTTHRPADKWLARLIRQHARGRDPGAYIYTLHLDGAPRLHWDAEVSL